MLTNGDASFARRGACVIIRAAGLVEEKVLVWFFNALENEGPAAKRRMAIDDMPKGLAPEMREERIGERRDRSNACVPGFAD